MGRRVDRVFSRQEIEDFIADGKIIVIYDNMVLSVKAWIPYHPGGDKSILHMVGRDATDEINGLHSPEAREWMKSYAIGWIEGSWNNLVPPIQNERNKVESPSSKSSGSSNSPSYNEEDLNRKKIEQDLAKYPSLDYKTQRNITQKYRELEKRIRAEGLYNCNYRAYGRECIRYFCLFWGCMLSLRLGWYKTSALLLGLFWHQLVFTAHDAGHMGITHNFQVDTCIGIFIANFCGGLSIGWWKRNHNVHHIVTNDPEHDPDIQHIPFFAVSHRFFSSLFSTYYDRILPYDSAAKFFVQYQNFLYYPVLLFGRFNLYRLSLQYLLLGQGPRKGIAAWHRYLELSGMVFFWCWFGYGLLYCGLPTGWDRFVYIMISHMVTMPLHVQITLSHFAMSTADLGITESFPQKMLRTTMDVECSEWLDFLHGGLQFQAVHHLYPRIPRHNLRRTQKLMKDFCKDVGIPYVIYGFYEGNKEVIGRLADIGRQAKVLADCQAAMIAKGEYGYT